MGNASLVVVGSGIKFLSHLTNEAKVYIQQSDKILYLVNDPAMKIWIQNTNQNAESLDFLYSKHSLRRDCYDEITNYILLNLKQGQHVCVVLYGHPSVFAQPGLNAVIQAKKKGYYAKILPGISAEDCLFADLLINPASHGCQSFEATDFLIRSRRLDPTCHLILWQIDIIGILTNPEKNDNKNGAVQLINYLKNAYPLDHEVIVYQAAQYPSFEPEITKLPLHKLPDMTYSRISTLYIPPTGQSLIDDTMLQKLAMDKNDLV